MMHYRIGDTFPLEGKGILGDCMDEGPRWFILRTPPMREARAQGFLIRNGALEAWHPTVTEWVPAKGANPRRRKIPIVRRIAPGYVFALFDREPRWHVLFDAARGRVSRVVTSGGEPLKLADKIIAAMQHVPERLLDAQKEADAERLRQWLAKQPVAGETADVKGGAMIGHTVDVLEIHGALAKCLAFGVREVWIETSKMERKG